MNTKLKLILSQVIKLITLLFGVSLVAFILVSLSPVDPVQQYILGVGSVSPEQRLELETYWGVNTSTLERYFHWLRALLKGDFGVSLLYRRPVIEIIKERFGNSFLLMLFSWLGSGVVGFILGCCMGINQNKLVDRIIKRICLILR